MRDCRSHLIAVVTISHHARARCFLVCAFQLSRLYLFGVERTEPPNIRGHQTPYQRHDRPLHTLNFPPALPHPRYRHTTRPLTPSFLIRTLRRWRKSVASWSSSVTVPVERPVSLCECRIHTATAYGQVVAHTDTCPSVSSPRVLSQRFVTHPRHPNLEGAPDECAMLPIRPIRRGASHARASHHIARDLTLLHQY